MSTSAAPARSAPRRPTSAIRRSPSAPPGSTELYDLLGKTSRTFALCVPELPEPTRREVCVAYLLFRIADTFEDATVRWSRRRRSGALCDLAALLTRRDEARARALTTAWTSDPPVDHAGYLELLEKTPEVLAALGDLSPGAQEAIVRHATRTSLLMSRFVEDTDADGVLRLEGLPRLRHYCYAVAGIVGELLTELFVLDRPGLEPVADYLGKRSALFGEGLQLVNILKDADADAVEGRNFLPVDTDRGDLFALARRDLDAAAEYTVALQRAGAPAGLVVFTALPVELAWATLDRVERKGPGAKISRARVFLLRRRVHDAVAGGRPVLARLAR